MDIFMLEVKAACKEYGTIIGIVKGAVNLICYAVPVIIIVLTVIDVAKVATSGNADDKLKKETSQKVITRLIYAVVIFLVPTVISLLFNILNKASPNEIKLNDGGKINDSGECNCPLIKIYLDDCK